MLNKIKAGWLKLKIKLGLATPFNRFGGKSSIQGGDAKILSIENEARELWNELDKTTEQWKLYKEHLVTLSRWHEEKERERERAKNGKATGKKGN